MGTLETLGAVGRALLYYAGFACATFAPFALAYLAAGVR